MPPTPTEPMFTLLLSVPLEGPLEKGGVIFVLRREWGALLPQGDSL